VAWKRYIHADITTAILYMSAPAKTGKKQSATQFKKGASGNPRGRRAGSRNKATMLLEKIMADDGEGVVNAVLEAAKVSVCRGRTVRDRQGAM